MALGSLKGLVVLDEVQRRPELFPTLRVLADRPKGPRFLVLGSASPHLLRQSSESLAGRIALQDLKLDSLDVIHAGAHTFPLGERLRAVALRRLLEDLKPLR